MFSFQWSSKEINIPGFSECLLYNQVLAQDHKSKFLFVFAIVLAPIFPGGSDSKASAYNAEDPGSIPGFGRSPGEGNGNPLQYACLENPMH